MYIRMELTILAEKVISILTSDDVETRSFKNGSHPFAFFFLCVCVHVCVCVVLSTFHIREKTWKKIKCHIYVE